MDGRNDSMESVCPARARGDISCDYWDDYRKMVDDVRNSCIESVGSESLESLLKTWRERGCSVSFVVSDIMEGGGVVQTSDFIRIIPKRYRKCMKMAAGAMNVAYIPSVMTHRDKFKVICHVPIKRMGAFIKGLKYIGHERPFSVSILDLTPGCEVVIDIPLKDNVNGSDYDMDNSKDALKKENVDWNEWMKEKRPWNECTSDIFSEYPENKNYDRALKELINAENEKQ